MAVLLLAACGDGGTTADPGTANGGSPDETAGDGTSGEETSAESVKLTYTSHAREDDAFGQTVTWWIDEIQSNTSTDFQVDTFFTGSLVGPAEALPAIQDGRADMGHVLPTFYPAELPLSVAPSIPFGTVNGEAVTRAASELYANNDAFRSEWEDAGVVILGWSIVPSDLLGFSEPVESIEDLDGLRLRAVGPVGEALSARGVEPVALGAGEIYESIERGVIDGYAGFPFLFMDQFGFFEVAPHVMNPGFGPTAVLPLVTINAEVFDGLPSDVQDAMTGAQSAFIDKSLEFTLEADAQACEGLLEAGGSVKSFSDEAIAAWKDDVQAEIIANWQNNAVEAGVDEGVASGWWDTFESKASEYEAESEYVEAFTACTGEE